VDSRFRGNDKEERGNDKEERGNDNSSCLPEGVFLPEGSPYLHLKEKRRRFLTSFGMTGKKNRK